MMKTILLLLAVVSLSGLLTNGFLFSYKPPPRPLASCDPQPCKYNGTCHIDTDQKAVCSCAPGHHGQFCKLKTKKTSAGKVDLCSPNPCGKGKCSMVGYKQVCTCPAGYLGDFCEAKDPCKKNPCKYGGKCSVGKWNQALCECVPGHHGRHCKEKTKKSVCDPNPCNHDGTCQVKKLNVGYLVTPVCTCKSWGDPSLTPKYEGKFCDYRTRDPPKTTCYPKNPCKQKAKCMVDLPTGDPVCACPPKFHGQFCQHKTRTSICDKDPCNKGKCKLDKRDPTKFQCVCKEGYHGKWCNKKTGCNAKPCKHKGVCTNLPNDLSSFVCECPKNYKGDRCQYKDKCLTSKTCNNVGKCQFDESTNWKPVCTCPLGFSGKKCNKRECGIQRYKMDAVSSHSKKLYLDKSIDRKVHDLDGLLKLCRVTLLVQKSFTKNPSQTQQSWSWRDKVNQHFYIGQAIEFELTDLKGKTYCNKICLSDPVKYSSMPGAKCFIEGLHAIGLKWSILHPTVIDTGFATANVGNYNVLREKHQTGCSKEKFPQ